MSVLTDIIVPVVAWLILVAFMHHTYTKKI